MNNHDEAMNVPSDSELAKLMESARHNAGKSPDIKRSRKMKMIAHCNQIVSGFYSDDSGSGHVAIKCLAVCCLQELMAVHSDIYQDLVKADDMENAAYWIKDGGKLELLCESISRIRIGSDDWLAD